MKVLANDGNQGWVLRGMVAGKMHYAKRGFQMGPRIVTTEDPAEAQIFPYKPWRATVYGYGYTVRGELKPALRLRG